MASREELIQYFTEVCGGKVLNMFDNRPYGAEMCHLCHRQGVVEIGLDMEFTSDRSDVASPWTEHWYVCADLKACVEKTRVRKKRDKEEREGRTSEFLELLDTIEIPTSQADSSNNDEPYRCAGEIS